MQSQPFNEITLVLVISEYSLVFDSTYDDMVQGMDNWGRSSVLRIT